MSYIGKQGRDMNWHHFLTPTRTLRKSLRLLGRIPEVLTAEWHCGQASCMCSLQVDAICCWSSAHQLAAYVASQSCLAEEMILVFGTFGKLVPGLSFAVTNCSWDGMWLTGILYETMWVGPVVSSIFSPCIILLWNPCLFCELMDVIAVSGYSVESKKKKPGKLWVASTTFV